MLLNAEFEPNAGGGGGGGTSNYNQLSNKPSINNVTLSGNKSASDLGLGTYSKPSGGIPDADIASASTWNAKGTYSKPSGGIPASDLASAVQTSLGKADTALQTAPVSSVNSKTGAVVLGAGDLEYDSTATYSSGTVGDELSDLKEDINNKLDKPSNAGTNGQVLTSNGSGGQTWQTPSGGSGLTDDIKEALLQIAAKVAYIDNDGADYYADLLDALYTLESITATYTQSGTVYTTDSLDSLKSDLVVTATYDDSSTATVTDYTLSGTLTEGTSTITVTYGGKTATFTVTVTAATTYLYNWDLTQSLTDSVNNRQITLMARESEPTASRDSSGLHFTGATQIAYLGEIQPAGKTFEIDVAAFDFKGDSSKHVRFFMQSNASDGGDAYGNGALIFRNTGKWAAYGYTTSSETTRGWSDYSPNLTSVNMFNGKTVKVVFDSDGHTKNVYSDGTLVATDTAIYFNGDRAKYVYIGGIKSTGSPSVNNGDQCYDMTITGIRIYANA